MTHEQNITELLEKNYNEAMYIVKLALRLTAQETAIEIVGRLDNTSLTLGELNNTRRSIAREIEMLEETAEARRRYIIALKELIALR